MATNTSTASANGAHVSSPALDSRALALVDELHRVRSLVASLNMAAGAIGEEADRTPLEALASRVRDELQDAIESAEELHDAARECRPAPVGDERSYREVLAEKLAKLHAVREPDNSALMVEDLSSLQEFERAGMLGIDAQAFVATVDDLRGLVALYEMGRGMESMALGLINRPNVTGAALTAVEAFDDMGARLANAAADKLATLAEEQFDTLDDGDISDLAPIVLPRAMSRHAEGRGGPATLASRLAARFSELVKPYTREERSEKDVLVDDATGAQIAGLTRSVGFKLEEASDERRG